MSGLNAGTITKTPGDRVWLEFDFGDVPELQGNAITAQDIPAVSGLTIAGVALQGASKVGAWFSDGADQADYAVTCTITLSDTSVVARTGTLSVRAN